MDKIICSDLTSYEHWRTVQTSTSFLQIVSMTRLRNYFSSKLSAVESSTVSIPVRDVVADWLVSWQRESEAHFQAVRISGRLVVQPQNLPRSE